jgi:DNA-binding beta-propeller fold protein YncE
LFAIFSITSATVAVIIVMIIAVIFARQGNNTSIMNSLLLYGKQLSAKALPSSSSSSFSLIQTIAIPNVNGRIDHMAIDIKSQRLFVAELENNSLDVIDLKAAKRIHSISNNGLLNEPQSVIFIPELNRIFVSNGQDGTVDVFDAKSFSFIKKIKLPSDDADNMRYDPNSKLLYVGYGEGSLGIINATNYNIIANIPLNGHPESFQIEDEKQVSLGQKQRIFINVPLSKSVEVVDDIQKHTVSKTWTITNAQNNFPMALDEANHRLSVGTREPPKLMVFDTNSGRLISVLDIADDADDIFYDAAKKLVYVSCGEGFINIFQQQDANHYTAIVSVPTAQGARTSLFVPELHHFYLAVPGIANQESKILVYQVGQQ